MQQHILEMLSGLSELSATIADLTTELREMTKAIKEKEDIAQLQIQSKEEEKAENDSVRG